MKLSKSDPNGAGWSDAFTSLWVKLWGDAASTALFKKVPWKIYNLSSGIHPNTCKIHQSQLNLDSLCARVRAAEWDKTKGM